MNWLQFLGVLIGCGSAAYLGGLLGSRASDPDQSIRRRRRRALNRMKRERRRLDRLDSR